MGPNGAEGKYILGACVHVDISCKEDYLCAHVRVLSLWISTWARKCPEEPGWACYGVMSGLISQLCLRLITHRPLGGGNREKKRRGGWKGHMGSAHYRFSFISTASSLGTRQDFDKGTCTALKTSYQPPPGTLCLPTHHTAPPTHKLPLEALNRGQEVWVEITLMQSEDWKKKKF